MVWYGMVWYGMVWYGMVWCGVVWYGVVYIVLTSIYHFIGASYRHDGSLIVAGGEDGLIQVLKHPTLFT